jgi:hypothetical protein
MPLSLQVGEGWSKSRTLLRKNYQDLCVVNIAAAKGAAVARDIREKWATGNIRTLEDGPVGGTEIRWATYPVAQGKQVRPFPIRA